MSDLMKGRTDFDTLANQYGNFLVPLVKIKVNGQDVVKTMDLHLEEVEVTCSLKAAGYARIKIGSCYDEEQSRFDGKIKDKFKLGTVVSVELGYLSHSELVFKGYVAMLGVELLKQKLLVVTLMDARRLMMTSGKKHLLWDVKNYSDAFQNVMDTYGKLCSIESDPTKDELEYPISQTSSDYDFVTKELARKGNREFFVFGEKAYFRKMNQDSSSIMKLQFGRELFEFRVDHMYLDAKIKVFGYNHEEEEQITYEKAVKSSLSQSSVMSTPEYTIVDHDVDSQEKAKNRGEFIAQYEKNRSCTGTGKTIGLPELVPGRYIEIEKVDDLVNKKYYISEVRHTIVDDYFVTEFEIGGLSG